MKMDLYEKILAGEEKLSLVGLGYVGMPIAVAFARKIKVIGYDLNAEKIKLYQSGIDPTNEVGDDVIRQTEVEFTADETKLREAKFHIVAVPTPVNDDHTPDLTPVEGASRILGRNLTKGSVVVFESTVYPGVTEEVCVPILEKESGLVCGKDFKIGYSPERINPGDKVHRLETITKIVSGMDEETLDTVAKVYELVVEAGVYRAESIQVAEAAKVIENSQRDINIAFMNELSIIFNKMGIDTQSVLKAAGTKWNFLKFLSRSGGRTLHRCRSVLSDLPRRADGLSFPDHSVRPPHQRRHGQICRRKHCEKPDSRRYRGKACEGCNPWLYLQGELPGYQKYKGYRYCKRAA